MNRRELMAGMGTAALACAADHMPPPPGSCGGSSSLPPRKVIVGTAMQQFWVKHPGLEKRLDQLTAIVDGMHAESQRKYGRGLDLAILPETAVSGEAGNDAMACAVPFDGPFANAFSRKARELGCYVIAPTYLRESEKTCSNAAVLFGRKGELTGIYRKVHLVVSADGKSMESGSTPGKEVPVFDCDFGRLGIQICYDMEFDRGWAELSRQGAELVAWPSESPQTAHPAARAMQQNCYIVSSTWRHNATVFEPTGKIVAQLKPPGQVLVQEIDLSYAILPWTSGLRNGEALKEMYGGKVGFRYYEDEDCGIFWSNDPRTTIRQMVQKAGLLEVEEVLAQVRGAYTRTHVLDY